MAEISEDQYSTFEASIHHSLVQNSQSQRRKYDSDNSSGQHCCGFLTSTKFMLCTSHTLASWGNRMWYFAVGLFMIYLSKANLRLTATYGFALGGAVMFFGPILGDMVDRMPRLKFARNVLFVIDVSIALSATAVCLTVTYNSYIVTVWNGWALTLCHCVIVIFAVVGNTASVGRMIAIERDWIVVMVKDKYELTALSALLRRIDLVTNLLAPVVVGVVFTYGSIVITSIFIAVWNMSFVLVEYALLYNIYKRVPELAVDKQPQQEDVKEQEENENSPLLSHSTNSSKTDKSKVSLHNKAKTGSKGNNCCTRFFSVFVTLFRGWKVYVQEETVFAGMALGFLHMTVLGFDNITTGFAIQEGLTSLVFGILSGIGSLTGVLGTIVFPFARRKIGLLKTGMMAFTIELMLLIPCVISVFAPGSLFDYDFLWTRYKHMELDNITTRFIPDVTSLSTMSSNSSGFDVFSTIPSPTLIGNVTTSNVPYFTPPKSYWSIGLLMFGIITSRFGLWMADLTVTQLLIETPKDHQRGIVNGVQNAINQTWNLTKYILVMLLPWPQTFGYLIMLTFMFISMACLMFTGFSYKARRHGYQVISDEKEREDQEKKENGHI